MHIVTVLAIGILLSWQSSALDLSEIHSLNQSLAAKSIEERNMALTQYFEKLKAEVEKLKKKDAQNPKLLELIQRRVFLAPLYNAVLDKATPTECAVARQETQSLIGLSEDNEQSLATRKALKNLRELFCPREAE